MSDWEKSHVVDAFGFELGKVDVPHIRERMVEHLNRVDKTLAARVAGNLGLRMPSEQTTNHGRSSPALSQADQPGGVETRKVAVLAADGVDADSLAPVLEALRGQGAVCEILAPHGGELSTAGAGSLKVDRALVTMASLLYDAVLVAGGEHSAAALLGNGEAVHYASEAYEHAKPLGALGAGIRLLEQAPMPSVRLAVDGDGVVSETGVVTVVGKAATGAEIAAFADAFAAALKAGRHFNRPLSLVAS